jgi:hypothetical protein
VELRDLQALSAAGFIKKEDIPTVWNYFKSGKKVLFN